MVERALCRLRAAATAIAILLALAPIAAAAEDLSGDQQRHGGWVFEATPYFWLPETHGTITVRDRSADLDIGFDDVFDLLGDGNLIGGMGHFEARKDRLAFFVDSQGVVINNDAHGKILRDRVDVDLTVDFDMAILELGAAYRLLEHGRFILEGLAGARYTYVYANVELDTDNGGGSRDTSENVVDPFFGIRGAARLADRWSFVVRSDVGGFGAGSQLAWTVLGGLRWELPWKAGSAGMTAFMGYKVYDLDFENGAGGTKREINVQMRGPALGMTFTF
jgi:hypothetical protein